MGAVSISLSRCEKFIMAKLKQFLLLLNQIESGTDRQDMTEILLKVALNTLTLTRNTLSQIFK
jgi:hypothetical protein